MHGGVSIFQFVFFINNSMAGFVEKEMPILVILSFVWQKPSGGKHAMQKTLPSSMFFAGNMCALCNVIAVLRVWFVHETYAEGNTALRMSNGRIISIKA